MNKKTIFTFCGVAIVLAIAAMLHFALSGRDVPSGETTDMVGTWKIVVENNNGKVTMVDLEYMVFDDEIGNYFPSGGTTAGVTSKYSVDDSMVMRLPDISKEYRVEKKTCNYVRLHETKDKYLDLIRYENQDMLELKVDTDLFIGRWDVIYRNASEPYAGDYVFLEEGSISDYRVGSDKPRATAPYLWEGGSHLIVEDWGFDMILHLGSHDTAFLVEVAPSYGHIWELKKSDQP